MPIKEQSDVRGKPDQVHTYIFVFKQNFLRKKLKNYQRLFYKVEAQIWTLKVIFIMGGLLYLV